MTSDKIRRNDPCPCGSGKRYKSCCGAKKSPPASAGVAKRISAANGVLIKQLFGFVTDTFSEDIVEDAWQEFMIEPEVDLVADNSPLLEAFFAWFYFNFNVREYLPPRLASRLNKDNDLVSIAGAWLVRHPRNAAPLAKEIIRLCEATNFSLFEVKSVQPGKGLQVQDMLVGRTLDVVDVMASQGIAVDNIVFARIIEYQGVGIILGSGPFLFDHEERPFIVRLRKDMQEADGELTLESLHRHQVEIRKLYLTLSDQLEFGPDTINADGDPIRYVRLFYDIESPQEIFDLLLPLSPLLSRDELLEDASFGRRGNLRSVEFDWLINIGNKKTPNNYRLFANILIDDDVLLIDVDSENRAKKARKEIEKRLKGKAHYLETTYPKFETDEDFDSAAADLDLSSPEGQAVIEQIRKNYWDGWIDERIPMLNNKTPKQASRSNAGKVKLRELLDMYEENARHNPGNIYRIEDIDAMRRQLGIEK